MKKYLLLAAVLASTPVMAKKEPAPERTPEPNGAELIARGEEGLRNALLDPEGARITWTSKPYWTSWKEGGFGAFNKRRWGWVVCGHMNARNRLGGYTGRQGVFIYLRADGEFRTGMAWDIVGACGPFDELPEEARP